jgi:signal transduction histidine kinase
LTTLFEPFVRGETHGQDGVGLGLSIAKQAADLIGAKLSVRSDLGKGTSFTLELAAD